ncbi:hypothetical protein [Arcanobacterium canis]
MQGRLNPGKEKIEKTVRNENRPMQRSSNKADKKNAENLSDIRDDRQDNQSQRLPMKPDVTEQSIHDRLHFFVLGVGVAPVFPPPFVVFFSFFCFC